MKEDKPEIEEHTLEVTRKAHLYINKTADVNTKFIWLVAHGYGQTGSRVIAKFSHLDPNDHTVICPEGLSLFYWGGVHGPHAASWMTSKNRLDEIDDYCNYLDRVYNKYIAPHDHCKVVVMGFSQGATTMYRWIQARKRGFDHFINWAGWMPEDIDMNLVANQFLNRHCIVFGNEDEYLTEERIRAMKKNIKEAGMSPDFETFAGRHEIKREVLTEIIKVYLNDRNH